MWQEEACKMRPVQRVVCLLVAALLVLQAISQSSCQTPPPDQICVNNDHRSCEGHRHYFIHNGHELPLVLESSERLSHQVTNHILQIILQDVLCYHSVSLKTHPDYHGINASAVLDRVTGCAPARCKRVGLDSVPDTMINLETWMEAGFNPAPWVNTNRLMDAGPLGPYGRMGWFVGTWVLEEQGQGNVTSLDHWRALTVQSVLRSLSWWGRQEWRQLCPDCEKGAYRSSRCTKSRKNCATLFSSVKGLDGGVLQTQIESLNLAVDIVWLGSSAALRSFVLNQTAAGERVLFFSWVPSDLTLAANFTRIAFPDQPQWTSSEQPTNSEFQVNQFSKVAWYRVKEGAPEAFEVVSRMRLPQHSLYSLLDRHRLHPQLSPLALACGWLRDNTHLWHTWLPSSVTAKPKLYLAGMFPLSGGAWIQPGLIEVCRGLVGYKPGERRQQHSALPRAGADRQRHQVPG